jgi:VanZ family protein
MGLIFMASTDAFSAAHTGRIIEPLLRWLFPHISAHAVNIVHYCVRKAAHLTEYAILGTLLWRAIPEHKRNPGAADWWRAAVALVLATFYAATDEFHQSFVPSRGPSVHDVIIDACGAAIALAIVCLANWAHARRPGERAAAQGGRAS